MSLWSLAAKRTGNPMKTRSTKTLNWETARDAKCLAGDSEPVTDTRWLTDQQFWKGAQRSGLPETVCWEWQWNANHSDFHQVDGEKNIWTHKLTKVGTEEPVAAATNTHRNWMRLAEFHFFFFFQFSLCCRTFLQCNNMPLHECSSGHNRSVNCVFHSNFVTSAPKLHWRTSANTVWWNHPGAPGGTGIILNFWDL